MKLYETRFSGGTVDIEDGKIMLPPIDIIYPGEAADTQLHIDPDAGTVLYTTTVGPAPGLWMWWLRLRYRLYGRRLWS